MIISRTPYRISLFGGGTDYPAWYRQHGGAVLTTTIDKYCYLTCRYLPPFFEHRTRIVYSRIESCHSIEEISHPAVREVLRFLKIERGVEIHHDGDLLARSGMGSSSTGAVVSDSGTSWAGAGTASGSSAARSRTPTSTTSTAPRWRRARSVES